MSAPVGTLRPNPTRLIQDIEGMMEAFRRIRELAEDLDTDPEDLLVEIAAISDEVLWPG